MRLVLLLLLVGGLLLVAGCDSSTPATDDTTTTSNGDIPSTTAERKETAAPKPKRRKRGRPSAGGAPGGAKGDRVVSVTDGDTIVLASLGKTRLIGIDTPEVYGGAECYGREASAFTKRKLPPSTPVRYVLGVEDTDRYGRALAYVWARGNFFNAQLVEHGYAVPLTIPPNVDYVDLFRRLAREARTQERGLWAASTCAGDDDRPVGGGGGSGRGGGGAPAGGDKDCSDFSTHAEAQRFFEQNGGPAHDPHLLDGNHDGQACESLP